MSLRLLHLAFRRTTECLALLGRGSGAKDVEILVLWNENAIFAGSTPGREGLGRPGYARCPDEAHPRQLMTHRLFTPATVLSWHRRLVARHCTCPNRTGRPPLNPTIAAMVEQMARDNPGRSTNGSKANCAVSATGWVRRPSADRQTPRHPTGTGASRPHHLATVSIHPGGRHGRLRPLPSGCALTLQRLYLFFVLQVGSRYVHILGVTPNTD